MSLIQLRGYTEPALSSSILALGQSDFGTLFNGLIGRHGRYGVQGWYLDSRLA